MALITTFFFTKNIIDAEKILKATRNNYKVVSARLYSDKKHELPDGVTLTLMVVADDFNYGVDKNGQPRESNLYQNFDVTVLNRKHTFKKGDMVRLLDFDAEHSYAIGFDLLLRFKDAELIQPQGVKPHA